MIIRFIANYSQTSYHENIWTSINYFYSENVIRCCFLQIYESQVPKSKQ